jgi:hypothetical protein
LTVCIAALATYYENGRERKVIILAGDRMMTSRRTREYELGDQTKAVEHRDNVVLLFSGSLDDLLEAYWNIYERVRNANIRELVKTLATELQSLRRRNVERQLLERYKLTLSEFIKRQKEWAPDFFERINSEINNPDWDLGDVIVAGFDGTDIDSAIAQIWTITGAGYERSWNATGFCAIGSGDEHAETEFEQARYSPKMAWLPALRVTGFAKKRAEGAPGVGPNTDLWYITFGGKQYFWPQSKLVQEIDNLYQSKITFELNAIATDAIQLGIVHAEEINARTPRAASEEELRQAQIKAEKGDRLDAASNDESAVSDGAQEGEP